MAFEVGATMTRCGRLCVRLVFGLAAVVIVIGGLWTAAAVGAWWQSERIQSGGRTVGVVVATGAISREHQQATLRYRDSAGREQSVSLAFPLGLAKHAQPGEATTIAYDTRAPGDAELLGHPATRVQDVLFRVGLTGLLTAIAVMSATLLLIRSQVAAMRSAAPSPSPPPPPPVLARDAWPLPRSSAAGEQPFTQSGARVGQAGAWPAIRSSQRTLSAASVAVLLSAALVTVPHGLSGSEVPFPPPPPALVATGRPTLPTVLSAPAPTSGPLVTPAGAREIVKALWPTRDEALVNRDLAAVEAVEDGPALQVDVARMASGGAPNRPAPSPQDVRDLGVYVPRQSRWPAYFIAEVVTTSAGRPFLEVMVVQRHSPSSPWRIRFDTGVSEGAGYLPHLEPPVLDGDGYDVVPVHAWIDAADVVPALARYWQSWADVGRPPAGGPAFADGSWTSSYVKGLADQQGRRDDNGLPARFTYDDTRASSDDVWQIGVYGSEALVCSALRESVVWQGPTTQDNGQQKWGLDLSPGVYRSITGEILREPCLLVPMEIGSLGVFGADRWVVSVRGVPN